jgi:hypothetical protein
MKVKLKVAVSNHKAGDIVDIPDNNGVPKDSFWRRRLKDAELDGNIEILKKKKRGVDHVNSK